MPSLIPTFEYDIFISYRQKDNKGDRWVTEFVNALKTELEATFKEDISIYFPARPAGGDENPHDGLLETHNVDNSLKDKLKCLTCLPVFIPIISQTYCDPKSFAPSMVNVPVSWCLIPDYAMGLFTQRRKARKGFTVHFLAILEPSRENCLGLYLEIIPNA